MHALERLALDDFEAEQGSQTWRSPHHAVAIDIVGPALDIESALARRKYAIWGIYKAVHLMVATGDFRCRNYELYWRGGLVGWVGYNNGLGMGGGMKNFTRDSVEEGSSLILPNTSRNVTTDSVGVDGVTFSFELHGRTIGESNVFMILFTAILKAAPFPKDERVRSFVVSGRPFNSYLSFMERLDPGPDGPFLKYEQVIQIFMQLPRWMISHGSQWSEANMVVLVDDRLVGTGVLVWQFRGEMGTVDGDTVTTS